MPSRINIRAAFTVRAKIDLSGALCLSTPEICLIEDKAPTPVAICERNGHCELEDGKGIGMMDGELAAIGNCVRFSERMRGSLRNQKHKPDLLLIEPPLRNKLPISVAVDMIDPSPQRSIRLIDASAEELETKTLETNSTSALCRRIDRWIHAVRESERKADAMVQETADLKTQLENILNEIISTRSQLLDTVPNSHPTSSVGISCSPHSKCALLSLECNVTGIQESCCMNSGVCGHAKKMRMEEDRRCGNSCSLGCEADDEAESCSTIGDAYSDVDPLFKEDVDTVLQNLLGHDSDRFTQIDFSSGPRCSSECIEDERGVQRSVPDVVESESDAMRSAYDLRSLSPSGGKGIESDDEEPSSFVEDGLRSAGSMYDLGEKEAGLTVPLSPSTTAPESFQNVHDTDHEQYSSRHSVEDNQSAVSEEETLTEDSDVEDSQIPASSQSSEEENSLEAIDDQGSIEVVEESTEEVTQKPLAAVCPDFFDDERSVEDAVILEECEKQLTATCQKKKSTFSFRSLWSKRKTYPQPIESDHEDPCPKASPSVSDVPEELVQFSKQCQRWTRRVERKRSFFGFFVFSFLWRSR